MKYNIPSIGDKIKLTRDWCFPLYFESRNNGLLARFRPGIIYGWRSNDNSIIVTLEKDTILRIDRIYIRKGKSEWDSITFVISDAPNDKNRCKHSSIKQYYGKDAVIPDEDPNTVEKLKGARFWAKLDDVNEIYYIKLD
jgi:hypothetical protein